MPALNGIDTAREIHSHNKMTQLVFLTISPEFALNSYDVEALDYIIKPINQESFNRVMKRFDSRRTKKDQEASIVIQEKSSIMQIYLNDLCYVEVLDHYLIYHLSNNEIIKRRQSLLEIESVLKRDSRFIKTHRSYIVNMDYIKKIYPSYITMTNGDTVSVSRSNSRLISDLFLKYKLEKGGK